MKAIVFHRVGDICVVDDPDPRIEQRSDAIIRITAGAICGTDLHFASGTVPGTILGYEAVEIVEEVVIDVRPPRPIRPDPVCQRRQGVSARRCVGRPGHHGQRHLPDLLLRRRHRGDRRHGYRRRLRLRSGRAVMHPLDAYKAFDAPQPGWIKVELEPVPQRHA